MTRNHQRLAQPWMRAGSAYALPGRVVVKLALGETPEHLPALADVRMGASRAARHVDRGPLDRVMNSFTDGFTVTRVHSAAKSLGKVGHGARQYDDVEHAIGLSRTLQFEVDSEVPLGQLIDALRQLVIVEEVSPQYLCTVPFAAAAATLDVDAAWQPRERINAPQALSFEPGDPTIIIGIVDTGVALNHPELQGRLRPGFNTVDFDSSDLSSGIHLVGHWKGPDADPEDFVGHGTSCAGIIGADGERIPPGLAGDCRLLPIRVLAAALMPGKDEPVGIGAIYDIDAGMKRSMDLGARVVNMSFGTPGSSLDPGDPKPHADIVRYGIARGCTMVAASGNSGKVEEYYPAAHDGVIAVGSVDKAGRPSSFSTTGEHVALSAPGETIVSTGLKGYMQASGTSFAAPFVTAAAALMLSYAEARAEPLAPGDIRRILRSSAQPFGRGARVQGSGAGQLDAYRALRTLEKELDLKSSPALPAGGRA